MRGVKEWLSGEALDEENFLEACNFGNEQRGTRDQLLNGCADFVRKGGASFMRKVCCGPEERFDGIRFETVHGLFYALLKSDDEDNGRTRMREAFNFVNLWWRKVSASNEEREGILPHVVNTVNSLDLSLLSMDELRDIVKPSGIVHPVKLIEIYEKFMEVRVMRGDDRASRVISVPELSPKEIASRIAIHGQGADLRMAISTAVPIGTPQPSGPEYHKSQVLILSIDSGEVLSVQTQKGEEDTFCAGGVAFNAGGDLFVRTCKGIEVYNRAGVFVRRIDLEGKRGCLSGISISPSGDIIVAICGEQSSALIFREDGKLVRSIKVCAEFQIDGVYNRFGHVHDVSAGPDGTIAVSGTALLYSKEPYWVTPDADCVRILDMKGKFLRSIGEEQFRARSTGQQTMKLKVCYGVEGELYVLSHSGHNEIMMFDREGKFVKTIDEGCESRMLKLRGLAVDHSGRLFSTALDSQPANSASAYKRGTFHHRRRHHTGELEKAIGITRASNARAEVRIYCDVPASVNRAASRVEGVAPGRNPL